MDTLMKRLAFLLVLPLFLTGCYNAQVTTGLTPSAEVIEVKWAHGFIYGLVPPKVVEAEDQCSNGVARVETKLSFLNQLVQAITFGIYSPMSISVTCATGGMAATNPADIIDVQRDSSEEIVIESFSKAIKLSAENERAAYVQFK
ncbi:MAG: Bor family protein [Balneolaceae bacterium]|nr:Bor family protein [Balneolaceae bacterium]